MAVTARDTIAKNLDLISAHIAAMETEVGRAKADTPQTVLTAMEYTSHRLNSIRHYVQLARNAAKREIKRCEKGGR